MPITREDEQTISEIVGRQIAQALNQLNLQQATQGGGTVGQAGTVGQEGVGGVSTSESRMEDIAGGEAVTLQNVSEARLGFSNNKVAFDSHLRTINALENDIRRSLQRAEEDARRMIDEERSYVAELRQDTRRRIEQVDFYKQSLMRSTVATGHILDLQAAAHRDVAVDATWEPGPGEGREPNDPNSKANVANK